MKIRKPGVSPKELRACFDYDKHTGAITWKVQRSNVYVGDRAGHVGTDGYRTISINGMAYKAHRIAWALAYGRWPRCELDHINHKRDDNRIKNLRLAHQNGNHRNKCTYTNSKSGKSGVHWHKTKKKWRAQICIDKKQSHLGFFDNLSDAVKSRKNAEKNAGYHVNHGMRLW